MLSRVRFSGVKIVGSASRTGEYKYYGFQVSPHMPEGVHYKGATRKSETADLLDLVAKKRDEDEPRFDEDYISPLSRLLEGTPFSTEKSQVARLMVGLVESSELSRPDPEALLTGLLGGAPTEAQKQTFWKILVAQLVQDAPMPTSEKERLLNAIRVGGNWVPGGHVRTGEIRLDELEVVGVVGVNGQLDVQMARRSGGRYSGREGVLLGVWA